MATLPTPGGDTDTWGPELNEYLTVSHDAGGFLKSEAVGELLAAATTINATTITLKRLPTATVGLGNRIAIGAGKANCEVRGVSNIVGTTLTLDGALKASHLAGENVWVVQGNSVPLEWFGARGSLSYDSARSLIQAFMDAARSDYALVGRGIAAYSTSIPLFAPDYCTVESLRINALFPFGVDCMDSLWDGGGNLGPVPVQYLFTLAGQIGTATFNPTTNEVTFLTGPHPGGAQYSDVQFYRRPDSTMPGGIVEGKCYRTIVGNTTVTTLSTAIGSNTPVDITSSGSGEIYWISTGLARLMGNGTFMLDGNYIKGLSGLCAQVQQPSHMTNVRVENFAGVGATIGAQQGAFTNFMAFDCWMGLELMGSGDTYFPMANIESCDINCGFQPRLSFPGFGSVNWNVILGPGFHWEGAGEGPRMVQTLYREGTVTGGTFQLRFKGSLTAPINWNDNAAQIQAKLEATSTVGSGNVICTQLAGTNLSNGSVRCDFGQGVHKWEFWEYSTLNDRIGGMMSILNSTITGGGVINWDGVNPKGRNIGYSYGVGNVITGHICGSLAFGTAENPFHPVADDGSEWAPPFIKFEGQAIDPSQGKFHGVTLNQIWSSVSRQIVVDDPLHNIFFTSDDNTSTGDSQWLDEYVRHGRHGGNVGLHSYWLGDGEKKILRWTVGGPLEEIIGHPGLTDQLLFRLTNGFMDFKIMPGEPAAPPADTLRLYVVLNAGKVELKVKFPTGVAQQVKIEA